MPFRYIFSLMLLVLILPPARAQLGLKEDVLTEKFGKNSIRRTTPAQAGFHDIMYEINPGYFLLAKIRETDSMTVLLSYSMRNPSISKQVYSKILRESFSTFKPSRKFTSQDPFDRRTCHYNPETKEMVMRIHGSQRKEFPLKGFLLVNEPALIDEILVTVDNQWTEDE
ncbi:MAG: hypothetical protein R3D00_01910 [Bacteroidia bacterium]